MHRKAVNHLRRIDPVMAGVIADVGPCRFRVANELTHFEAVLRSIIYQQLSGKAAGTIHGRVTALFEENKPNAHELRQLADADLRAAGVSTQKLGYLRNLTERVVAGDVPIDDLHTLEDDEVLRHLTSIKGVGKWTAQMFLMFRLGRPDILPEGDLGIQKGIQKAYRLRKLPPPARVLTIGAKWAPHRTIASWYLWRSLGGDAE
ncbi:MAG: DNA-3-methyladenine glycosylase 2 family protein [Gemmatimonadaceae bacterium]